MTRENARKFWTIFIATMLVVAYVWHVTAPETPHKKPAEKVQGHQTKPVKVPAIPAPALPEVPKPPKEPTLPPPAVSVDMRIPALAPEKKASVLAVPDILPRAPEKKHVDPRIAATVLTSGDEFDRLVNGALSLFVYVLTH